MARLEMTRERARREMLLGLDSAHSWASAFGRASLFGPVTQTLDAEVKAVASVTHADVVRVVQTYLLTDSGRSVVTVVPPSAADPEIPPPPLGPESSTPEGGAQ
jgi:predicted Zn-dependent peptidase